MLREKSVTIITFSKKNGKRNARDRKKEGSNSKSSGNAKITKKSKDKKRTYARNKN